MDRNENVKLLNCERSISGKFVAIHEFKKPFVLMNFIECDFRAAENQNT